ncbi:MAG: MFS transporter [Defluviitaleaceae bacterium]|nr:MFS transporter [Defluviitaleaceae bacterium]
MKKNKIRITLAIFCVALTAALGVFVWIMFDVSRGEMSDVLLRSLILVAVVTGVAQIIYALKGQIFEFDGKLATREILFAVICFQIVMQFSFGFSVYAVNQTELQNKSFDSAYAFFLQLQESANGNNTNDYSILDFENDRPDCIDAVFLTDANDVRDSQRYYRFPVNDGRLLMRKSSAYFANHLQNFALSMVMSLVISVLLMAEIVFLFIKLMDGKREKKSAEPAEYLRQTAFLFYFTGFLGISFIPIMARNFAGSHPNADFIAGLPYSVEAFFNCAAILLTPKFFQTKGWKPLYLSGCAIFIVGLVFSAAAPNVFSFIGARALVGIGYGFCWMTLRNIATQNENRAQNFAGLTSGIYAGIMCGVAFGAVLADSLGFEAVLIISAAMAFFAAIFPMTMKNSKKIAENFSHGEKINLSARDVIIFVIFLALIVIPTSISDAFNGFLLPLYVNDLELPTAYIGRVTLVYNLCFVYLSSILLLKIVWKYIKNPLFIAAFHMLIISGALFAAAYIGGFSAVLVAGALLGAADGFGFSVQNSYLLDMKISKKFGTVRMLTFISLFKKLAAMLAPIVFGLFIMNGFGGLGAMGAVFLICAVVGTFSIIFLYRKESAR